MGVLNWFVWGCFIKEYFFLYFLEYLGNNYLDIGVGIGFYFIYVFESNLIFLMDLNEVSLNVVFIRVGELKIKYKISYDVFEFYFVVLYG